MMEWKTEYKMILGAPREIEALIQEKFDDGWTLQGGPMVYVINNVPKMAQAMVRAVEINQTGKDDDHEKREEKEVPREGGIQEEPE